jgi:hypothetical protein
MQVSVQEAAKLQLLLAEDEQQCVAQAQTAETQRERMLARAFVRCVLAKYLRNTRPELVSRCVGGGRVALRFSQLYLVGAAL